MIYQYSILRRELQAGIMVLLTAFILSGCAGQGRETKERRSVVESVQTEEEKTNEIEETEEIEPSAVNMKVYQDSLHVDIYNEEGYGVLVDSLEKYLDCHNLTLGMQETDTVIYLDEILAYHNFSSLQINFGGVISVRNMDSLKDNPLEEIELDHVYEIEENIISQMPGLQKMKIRLGNNYKGVLPMKELTHNTDCNDIDVIWDDNKKYETYLEGLTEWDEINALMSENDGYLKGMYVWNEGAYNFVSYEFCEEETEKACAAFISIKDRESCGKKYFDILEVPVEGVEVDWSCGSRLTWDDLNFDGYFDLIFMGWRRISDIDPRRECIGFLWNEKEQRYKWNATVPKYYGEVDAERKRITNVFEMSANDEEYYIYEYHDNVFAEKKLEVIYSTGKVTWRYYEDGELLKRLERTHNEEAKVNYITYEERGIITEVIDYDNKYSHPPDLGREYFPEFDFYSVG